MSRLTIKRRRNETLCIGDDVEVTITEIKGGQVRISVDAPRDVAVHRKEIKERIDQERRGDHGQS